MTALASPQAPTTVLQAYLPRTLAAHWDAHPDGPAVWHETLTGSLMHVDVSGFTAMSERLSRLGNEGAELMAGVLNRFFDRMLGIAARHGGVQMKFGGDAMLLYFAGETSAVHAAASGLEMQAAMPEFRAVQAGGEAHRLRMRAGIHSGRFFTVSAGRPSGSLHYLVMGEDVSMSAAVEAAAQVGQVVASAASAKLLEGRAQLARRGDVWRVQRVERALERPPSPDVEPHDALRRYLLPPFAREIARGRDPHTAPEHRPVTPIFINLLGVAELLAHAGEDTTLRAVDAYMNVVMSGLEKHRGFLIGSDAADHGDKLIILFGAPVASEGAEASALRFALDVNDGLRSSGLPLRHRIGVNSGYAFAGEIGSTTRREYTVIGDTVNVAARLMAAAPDGGIYASASTVERAGGQFALRRMRPLAVKGKTQRIPAFRVLGEAAAVAGRLEPAREQRLVGRERELGLLRALAGEVERGGARVAHVAGEPGIGKSAMVAALGTELEARGWRRVYAYCQAHRSREVLGAWGQPLHVLLDIEAGAPPDAAWTSVEATLRRLAPEHLEVRAVLATALGLPSRDDDATHYMDARMRRQHLVALVRALLEATAAAGPLVIVFDDVHFADGASLDLLAEVTADLQARLLVCMTSRDAAPPDAMSERVNERIELHELGEDEARAMAAAAGLQGQELQRVLARARGNPLFLEELAAAGDRDAEMPRNVHGVILARLDRLAPVEKQVLRAASVAGVTFDAAHLPVLLAGSLKQGDVDAVLGSLRASGFVHAIGAEGATDAFRHAVTQEVIYETLPYAQRRSVHLALARHIEETGGVQAPAGVLLHHYERGGDLAKTVTFAAISGDRAAAAYANSEAIDFYTRGMSALDRVRSKSENDRSLLLERIGECLELQGRHSAASEAFTNALERWRKRGSRRRARLVYAGTPDRVREAALCRRIGVSYERSSAYEDALRWLERALRSLPARAGRLAAEVYAAKSVTLYRTGEYARAIDCGRIALAAARRAGEPRTTAYAHNMLAQSYMAEGSLRLAVRHYAEAVRIYDDIRDVPGQAAAHNNLGSCYQLMGRLDEARHHYEVALQADERVGDLVDMAIIHNNIGEILLMQGNAEEAERYLRLVLAAHQKDEELTAVAGLSYVNLCRCRLLAGDAPAAEEMLREGMRLLRRVGARGLLNEARLQRAEVSLARGDAARALREAQGGLKAARMSGDKLLEARGERIVGLARAAAGDAEAGAVRLATSAALARRIAAGYEEGRSLLALNQLRMRQGARPRPAAMRRAAAIFERMGAAHELAQARELLAALDGSVRLRVTHARAAR